MKTPKKAPRRKSAVGKASSKYEGAPKSGLRRTNGYEKVDNTKVTFAGRGLKSPGERITPGEEVEFSEDELGATATTVGVEIPGIRDDRGGMKKTEFANNVGMTEPVKRKLEGVHGGVDGEPVYGECVSLFTSPNRMKKMKLEKDMQTGAVKISGTLPPQQPVINGVPSSPVSIPTPLSRGYDVVNGQVGELERRGTDHKNAPEHQQVLPAEAFEDPNIGRTLHARYHILGTLGRGNFSTTYLAKDLPPEPEPPDASNHLGRRTGTLVAVKRVNGPWLNPMGQAEYETLHSLYLYDSPRHIIKPLFAFFDQEYIFHLVLESLDSARPVSLPEGCACVPSHIQRCKSMLACPGRQYLFQKLMVQMLSGIHELHRHGLIHSDLTPANILYLPESNRIKIIDLGNAIKVDDPPLEGEAQFEVQSAHYRAPEILLGAGPLERKIDVWGAGVVGLEWLLGIEGRKELETDIKLIGKGSDVDMDTVWQPIMAVSTPSRKALVTRMATLFGSVGSYRQGVFWRVEYDALGRMPVGTVEVDKWGLAVSQENYGIFSRFLINNTLSPGLTKFMGDMLQVDIWQRKTSAEVLRDEWLVKGLLGEWASVLLSDAPVYHRVGIPSEVVVRDGTVTSCEEVWVEGMDDSGFAESAPSVDGKEMEIKGIKRIITPTDQLGEGDAREDTSEEDIRKEPKTLHHCNHTATTPQEEFCGNLIYEATPPELPTAHDVAESFKQLAPSTPPQKIKRFDDIPFDDGLRFLSPTDFPFTYTRFCPSPSPPLPRLFQSPSPEPLPPPSPGQLAQTEIEEQLDVLSSRPMTDNADFVGQDSNEEGAHDMRQQLQGNIQPKITLLAPQRSPRPSITLNDTPEVMSQEQPQGSLKKDDGIKEPDLDIWHMDLAIGSQVVFLSHFIQ
ncbi:kinase-like domain-containing protein [Tirmania nivea]|nr:kinase-like domain-containing protein [Tirmania nivea]